MVVKYRFSIVSDDIKQIIDVAKLINKTFPSTNFSSVSPSSLDSKQSNFSNDIIIDMATGKQQSYLKKLGYEDDPSILTKKEASDKIKELGGN